MMEKRAKGMTGAGWIQGAFGADRGRGYVQEKSDRELCFQNPGMGEESLTRKTRSFRVSSGS